MRALLLAMVVALPTLAPCGHAAQRTFVSSTGSNANPCSIAAPCRGFAAALTHTDPDGEIIVLDSAGYGPVTIDRSVSIIAPSGVYAGVSVFAGDGIVIAGGGIDVVLRGLTINGQGGNRGILYTLGSRLRISNCVVSRMSGSGVSIAFGGEVTIEDSEIRDNGVYGIGITLNPNVVVTRTRVERNSSAAIAFEPSATAANLTLTDSHIVGNPNNGILVNPAGVPATFTIAHSTLARQSVGITVLSTSASEKIVGLIVGNSIVHNGFGVSVNGNGPVSLSLTDNVIGDNSNFGVQESFGASALLVLDRNTITHNGTGIKRDVDSVIETRSNNTVRENGTNTVGAPFTTIGGT